MVQFNDCHYIKRVSMWLSGMMRFYESKFNFDRWEFSHSFCAFKSNFRFGK